MLDLIRLFLWPFSLLYGGIIYFRNKAYDWGILKSYSFSKPIICIGNLAVGGAGKTPATEYMVELLKGYKLAILSRGYGRKTKGFILAQTGMDASQIGDEPKQYLDKFPQVTVAVCEDRVKGVQQLIQDHDIILLDDAYQHRRIKAGFQILLFEFEKLLKPQFLLPTGNLRESMGGRHRADSILITKCPEHINTFDRIKIHKKVDMHQGQRVSFAHIKYAPLQPLINDTPIPLLEKAPKIYLLTGIANPSPLMAYLKQFTNTAVYYTFPDHHPFTRAEIEKLVATFKADSHQNKLILTTEKDSKRLLGTDLKDLLLNLPIAFIPIKMEIASKDKAAFEEKILAYVTSTK
ncbi:MAG: tetraacyldisaccharide 4'-kinase [Pedobacter sp.]|nr:MAG: tetraacyldisaccharide 4'-kinase [Pedobacter sp.]